MAKHFHPAPVALAFATIFTCLAPAVATAAEGLLITSVGRLVGIQNDVVVLGKKDKTTQWRTDKKTQLCIAEKKVKSLQEFNKLIGNDVTVYYDATTRPADSGQTYIVRIEDGAMEFTVGMQGLQPRAKQCR